MTMSLKRLKNYLDAIEKSRPIDAEKFRTLLEQLKLPIAHSHNDFVTEKVRDKQYLVQIVNQALKDNLTILTSLDGESRTSLASQNRSHDTSVSGSMLIVRHEEAHPEVIVFDHRKHYQGSFPMSAGCLILENEQNFLQSKQTLKLMRTGGLLSYEPIDIIFGDGAAITNNLYDLFFEQYYTISLSVDFDLGGLSIARTLIKRHSDTKVKFLYPEDIETRLSKVLSHQPADYLRKVEKIGRECPSLAMPASIIRKHRKVLEQEEYLKYEI